MLRKAILYSGSIAVILGWWYMAFSTRSTPIFEEPFQKNDTRIFSSFGAMAPIDRAVLHKALSGDIPLMTQLIADWDIDAQLLETSGHSNVKRLKPHEYLRTQVIGRQLILEDKNPNSPRILPQTYVSASFLLALAQHHQIVGLPKGLREQKQLFAQEITNKIPLDVDRYNAETLYMAQPEIAFIAHYSHPAVVQALQNQGTKLVTLTASNAIDDVHQSLIEVGRVAQRPLQAELLSLFMEAAMQAIDNRLLIAEDTLKKDSERILFVNYHTHFTLPTVRTLTGQILRRMGIPNLCSDIVTDAKGDWLIPLNREQIAKINPKCLIIATSSPQLAKEYILHDPSMTHLAAVENRSIFFVDEAVQQFPSQYLVLAYFDIAQALLATQ